MDMNKLELHLNPTKRWFYFWHRLCRIVVLRVHEKFVHECTR